MDDAAWVVAMIALSLLGLWIAFWAVKKIFFGAIAIFAWASEQGFLGFIAYFAAWVFLFPLMIIFSFIGGLIHTINEKEDHLVEKMTKDRHAKRKSVYEDETPYEKDRGY